MSDASPSPNKTVAAAVATLAVVGGLLGFWPQLEPVLNWLVLHAAWIALQSQSHAIMIGVLVGVSVSWFVPHYLPAIMPAKDAKRRMGLACSLVTFAVAWHLERTQLGFWLALIAGMIGWPLVLGLANIVYRMLPNSQPGSLEP